MQKSIERKENECLDKQRLMIQPVRKQTDNNII